MNLRTRFLNFIIPISKLISLVCRPEMKVTSEEVLKMDSLVLNGDCLVSRTEWEFSNLVLPGYWKHCGIYLNGYVYEATTHGVRKVLFGEFCFKKDHVGIARPKFIDEYSKTRISFLETSLGKGYDWAFSWMDNTSDAWYCSEYVYAYYWDRSDEFSDCFERKKIMGEYTVEPSDYWNASKFFEQVYRTPSER